MFPLPGTDHPYEQGDDDEEDDSGSDASGDVSEL